jgi:hypothetical protein
LPLLITGFSTVTPVGINASGWVAGSAGDPDHRRAAVVWKPTAGGYTAIDLGASGTSRSWAAGIDDQAGRSDGRRRGAFHRRGAFVWTRRAAR